ncbi:MAG: hypothetical protein HQL74_03445 [Magnetococcales bacterium]|nr:hypothetical protein [Magnetococcales bacterium]
MVAIIGLDSNHSAYTSIQAYKHGMVSKDQLDKLKQAIDAIKSEFKEQPVYVTVVLHHHLLPVRDIELMGDNSSSPPEDLANTAMQSILLDGPTVIRAMQGMRVSLVLHGHMHEKFIVKNIDYLTCGQKLAIVGCPSFPQTVIGTPRTDARTPGGVVLTFDTVRGTAQVDVIVMQGDDQKSKSIALPLISVTRISASEHRVWNRLNQWLSSPQSTSPKYFRDIMQPHSDIIQPFRQYAEKVWKEEGYVPLWGPDNIPLCVAGDERELPTKRYRLLLILKEDSGIYRILLNNHIAIRNTVYGTWDAALLPAFKHVGDFFDRVRNDLIRVRDDLMIQNTQDVRHRNRTLKSLEEALAQLSSCADDKLEEEITELDTIQFIRFSPTDGIPQRYLYSLCILPSLSLRPSDFPSEGTTSERTVSYSKPLQTLPHVEENCYFRYEPDKKQEDRSTSGYIWFPLNGWEANPAIKYRNGYIMDWVQRVIDELRNENDGHIHENLLLGHATTYSLHNYSFRKIEVRTFNDLVEKLRCVPLNYNPENYPYATAQIRQVVLRRVPHEGNDVIQVSQPDTNEILGFLCPSQRYVLRQGLNRARELRRNLINTNRDYDPCNLGTPQFGYLTAFRGNRQLDILPPILESVLNKSGEFLICDGNHRVVQYCWNDGEPLNAILISNPTVPYYIYQMRPEDWHVVASRPLSTTPELVCKYAVREMSEEEMKKYVSASIEKNKLPSSGSYYRVLYRNFSSAGFNLGAQGGIQCIPNKR